MPPTKKTHLATGVARVARSSSPSFRSTRIRAAALTAALTVALLGLAAAPGFADDYLMYGPSLAVWLEQNRDALRRSDAHHRGHAHRSTTKGGTLPFTVDESHFATDAGHTVTIVDEAQWSALTTEEFAAFDAIVIGDAGCDFDDGYLLETVDVTKATWSPAVTGHLFLHTFDPVYHFNQNSPGGTSPEEFQAMVDLSVAGMEFAASAGSTGLYHANGCRSFSGDDGRFEFLSLLGGFDESSDSFDGDGVTIVETGHPVMALLSDGTLSDWSNSYHNEFGALDSRLQVLAQDSTDTGPGAAERSIIAATRAPLGDTIVFVDGFESGGTGGWSSVVP